MSTFIKKHNETEAKEWEGNERECSDRKWVQKKMPISAAGARLQIARERIQIETTTKNSEAKQN